MNNKFYSKIFIAILSTLLIVSCVEKIDFSDQNNDFQRKLVVDGQITLGNGPFFVKLSRSSEVNDFTSYPQSDAIITLFDDMGNEETATYDLHAEQYVFQGVNVKGEVGHSYYIEIKLGDGSCYESVPEILPQLVQADSLSIELIEVPAGNSSANTIQNNAFEIYVHTEIANPETYLKWDIIEAYSFVELLNLANPLDPTNVCYFENILINPQNISIFSAFESDVSKVSFPIGQKKLNRNAILEYKDKNIISVYQQAMTKAAYEYWEQQKLLLDQNGGIFDIPPATIQGNIYAIDENIQNPLGYFSAVNIDTIRRGDISLIYKDLFQPIDYCTSRPTECFNCLILEGTSLARPSYFDE